MAKARTSRRQKAIDAINRAGIVLVFPIKNEKAPASLWYELYPKSEMRWDWGDDADDRVVDLWHLRTELSESRDVVYGKWFRGRATFFSRDAFVAVGRTLGLTDNSAAAGRLSVEGRALYEQLLDDSPQTPTMLRAALGLEGRANEGAFNRALKELWNRLLTVGFGEVDQGSFPALAIGATKLMFEDLWDEVATTSLADAEAMLGRWERPEAAPFFQHLKRLRAKLAPKSLD